MNRLARVVAKSNHSVVVQLIQAEKCAGCPINCNKPLIDFFALRKNLLTLSKNSLNYQLIDANNQLSCAQLLNQVIKIEINTDDILKSSSILYLLPLLIIVCCLTAGHYAGLLLQISSDLTALAGFIAGLIINYLFFKNFNLKKRLKFRPKVTIL